MLKIHTSGSLTVNAHKHGVIPAKAGIQTILGTGVEHCQRKRGRLKEFTHAGKKRSGEYLRVVLRLEGLSVSLQ